MNYLIDTHVFLWWDMESSRLSSKAFALIQNSDNTLFVSLASVREMQIKVQIGKLKPVSPLPDVISKQWRDNQIELLPIELPHIFSLASLPDHHKDPFDRLLIAQAQVEGLTLITNDSHIVQYPIQTVW